MLWCIENSEDATQTCIHTQKALLELTGSAKFKINTKVVAFLYINNELSQTEIKKTISFTITYKRIKYLTINLTNEAKDLYTENYKTLLKEIKDTNKWKNIPC